MREPDVVYGDHAYYEGEDHPRCQATPEEYQGPGTWGCALPAGHEDFDNRRVHPHTWVRLDAAEPGEQVTA